MSAAPSLTPCRAIRRRRPARREGKDLALAATQWIASRALTLASGLGAAVPVIAATIKAVHDGWVPGDDKAIIATRSYDVFTSHAPLVGQYTLAGEVTGKVTHSLGPMLFWLLALPAHFGSAASIAWTMGAVNTLAIVGSVALARRRGGLVLMFAAAVAIALMCQSLAAETFHDVWNPSAGLFPFTLEIFLCWSLACGEYRLLPLTALVASFTVQAHLMYLPPTIGLAAVGIGGLALARRSSPPQQPPAGTVQSGDTVPRTRRLLAWVVGKRTPLAWVAATLAVLAVCWSAPVIDELSESPGNMTLVVRSATSRKATLGSTVGWHAVVRAVGVTPWWLYVPAERWERKHDVRQTPTKGELDSCLALLAALLLALVAGVLRRRRDVVSGALIGFVLCAGLAAVAASTPTPRLLSATLGYTMWAGSQVGMWVWLMLAWFAWLVLTWAWRRLARSVRHGYTHRVAKIRMPVYAPMLATTLGCVGAVAGTAAVGRAVAATGKPDEHLYLYKQTSRLAKRLVAAVPSHSTVELLGYLGIATMPMKPALRYFLVRHGVRPLAPGSFLRLGDWYELHNRPYQYVVYVQQGVRPPARGLRLLDRVGVSDGWGHQTVSLWMGRHIAGTRSTPTHPKRAPAHTGARQPLT